MDPHTVRLAGETDVAGFRRAARALLAAGVAPPCVAWQVGAPGLLHGDDEALLDDAPEGAPVVRMPAAAVALVESAALHREPGRFELLYRLLWRLAHEPALRHDPLDADVVRVQRLARAVQREQHKMKAFLRFRTVDDGGASPLHVAWFEPAHHVVEAVAPFLARRFAQMRWAVLTPERSVRWDGARLEFGPGARREDAPPADAGEALWLTYYASIFNPARLKLAAMRREMPRRYWSNLPEAPLIAPLAAAAGERSAAMVARGPSLATRRRPAAHVAVQVEPRGLDALRAATDRCRECPIGAHATQSVVGEGPLRPRLMFVGEQPGDQEDLQGRPFVGPAGRLLDRALAQLGVARETVFVSNAVKHFKFELRGKRRIHKTPAQREAAACLHWLEEEIALVQPQALVALGATAARSLLGRAVAVTSERGQWLVREDGRRVLVTLHPSALLRLPDAERDAAYARWLEDLRVAVRDGDV